MTVDVCVPSEDGIHGLFAEQTCCLMKLEEMRRRRGGWNRQLTPSPIRSERLFVRWTGSISDGRGYVALEAALSETYPNERFCRTDPNSISKSWKHGANPIRWKW